MRCEHCEVSRNPEFSYNGHVFCCECMSELCSWFLDGGQQENPEQFAYVVESVRAALGTEQEGQQ